MNLLNKYACLLCCSTLLLLCGTDRVIALSPGAGLAGYWKITLLTPDAGEMALVMDFSLPRSGTADSCSFNAGTRKNADRQMLGFGKAQAARWFSPRFKQGRMVCIRKGFVYANDSLTGVLRSPARNYYISAQIKNSTMTGFLLNGRKEIVGRLSGIKGKPALPLRPYRRLADSLLRRTEELIYDPAILGTKEWHAFSKNMKHIGTHSIDDAGFMIPFFYYARKLPFTHYMLFRYEGGKNHPVADDKKYVTLQEKGPGVAYMRVASFAGSAEEMDSVFNLIDQRQYTRLIVDLRDNPGGSVTAGLTFSRHLSPKLMYGGVFLTQRYFRTHKTLPTPEMYEQFPHFSEASYGLILDGIHKEEGLCLQLQPKAPVYRGKLYVLINKGTASACEPIVYSLKQRKRAVLVGERTAGAMLNGETFALPEGFKLVLPTATYYTSDGVKLDGRGVDPDKAVPSAEALTTVLNELHLVP
jgi:hypothetical protein